MGKFLGVKIVSAEPMQKEKWEATKKFEDRDDHSLVDGYVVVYEDGYVSWSPKDVFEKAYRRIDNLTYGLAIEALRLGKRVARAGWNGVNMFVFKQVSANVEIQYVPNMQSLPDAVKDEFVKRGNNLNYSNQMCIVKEDNTIDSWVASSSDTFAEDWIILE